MSIKEEELKSIIRKEICSVSDQYMDIEPESDYLKDTIYCLKHRYLSKKEYWLNSIIFNSKDKSYNGIRINKSKSKPCPRRNFVDLFTSVTSFNEPQSVYISKILSYLIKTIAPAEKDIAEHILYKYVRDHRNYCFNYYASESHEQSFYVVDGFVKFKDKPLSEHIKISFNVARKEFSLFKDIHFYIYDNELICSFKNNNDEFTIIDTKEDYKILACNILKPIILPIIINSGFSEADITPENIDYIINDLRVFKEISDMIEI